MHDQQKQEPWNSPLALRYGYEILDHGFTAVPNLFLQAYSDLHLKDQEANLIIHLLTRKRGSQSPTFRLGDLPMTASIESRKRYLRKLRQLGLVFTRRVYYEGVFPARLRHIELDLSNLLHNLLRWSTWVDEGRPGEFHIALDPQVAARIQAGHYHFVTPGWRKEAQQRESPVPGQNDAVQGKARGSPPVPGQNDAVQGTVPGKSDPSLQEYPSGDTLELFESQSGPPGGPAARRPSHRQDTGSNQPPSETVEAGAESLGEPAAPASANAAPSHRMPAGRVSGEQASPGGLPAEPLPLRRRRVLRDLGQARGNLRRQVAILTKNLGALLGFERGRRTAPERSDYGRVGALAKQFGAREVWLTACRIAGLEIEGDALAYLQRCLEQEALSDLSHPHPGPPPPSPKREGQGTVPPKGHREETEEVLPPPRRPLPLAVDSQRGMGQLMLGTSHLRPNQQPERSTYIANLIADLSRQFGDLEHIRENDAQAHNLWHAFGLDEEAFVQRMYQARRTTLQLAGARNRMAYFFAVLRDLVQSEETPAPPPDLSPTGPSSTTDRRKMP